VILDTRRIGLLGGITAGVAVAAALRWAGTKKGTHASGGQGKARDTTLEDNRRSRLPAGDFVYGDSRAVLEQQRGEWAAVNQWAATLLVSLAVAAGTYFAYAKTRVDLIAGGILLLLSIFTAVLGYGSGSFAEVPLPGVLGGLATISRGEIEASLIDLLHAAARHNSTNLGNKRRWLAISLGLLVLLAVLAVVGRAGAY
jgi:hypothetical protein